MVNIQQSSTPLPVWFANVQPNVLHSPLHNSSAFAGKRGFWLLLGLTILFAITLIGGYRWQLAAMESAVQQRTTLVAQWQTELQAALIAQQRHSSGVSAARELPHDFLQQLSQVPPVNVTLNQLQLNIDTSARSLSSRSTSTTIISHRYQLMGAAQNMAQLNAYVTQLQQYAAFQNASIQLARQITQNAANASNSTAIAFTITGTISGDDARTSRIEQTQGVP